MDLSLNSCHFLILAAILLVFSDRALCADEKRRAIADTRKTVLGKKASSFASDVMHDGSGGGMSADIDWDGSGHGPDDEDADDDLDGQASGHRVSDTEGHRSRPAAAAGSRKDPNGDDEDDGDDGQPSGDHIWEDERTTTTTTTLEPTTTTRRRPEPPTTAEDIVDGTDEPPKEQTTKAPPPTVKAQPTEPPTTIYDTENRRTLDPFLRPGILAAVIGGAVVGLLAAILLVMFIVYRMRKKDEGSYALDEPKQPPHYSYAYQKAPTKEFYA